MKQQRTSAFGTRPISAGLGSLLAVLAFGMAAPALAHETAGAAKGINGMSDQQPVSMEQHAVGRQGDPARATRTIAIDMTDMMRYGPANLTFRQGETVTLVVKNKGKMLHEIVLGTQETLKVHHEQMRKHPEMEHDAPYMAHVSPGAEQTLTWQFNEAGEFHYACLLPGHFEAGMVGTINVIPKEKS